MAAQDLRQEGPELKERAQGLDNEDVHTHRDTKSVSAETTMAQDVGDEETLVDIASRLGYGVAERIRRNGLRGKTVSLKLRLADFTTFTRQVTLPAPTDDEATIARGVLATFCGGKSGPAGSSPGGRRRQQLPGRLPAYAVEVVRPLQAAPRLTVRYRQHDNGSMFPINTQCGWPRASIGILLLVGAPGACVLALFAWLVDIPADRLSRLGSCL